MQEHISTTIQLARFAAATAFEAIPNDVLHHGKRCIINMLAVALYAAQNPALGILLDVLPLKAAAGRLRCSGPA